MTAKKTQLQILAKQNTELKNILTGAINAAETTSDCHQKMLSLIQQIRFNLEANIANGSSPSGDTMNLIWIAVALSNSWSEDMDSYAFRTQKKLDALEAASHAQ